MLSIRDVAGNLRTDPATVLRIVRSLRFRSYREFKANLHDLSIASAISLEGIQAHTSHDSSLNSHGHKALEQDHRNLRALPNTLNRKRVAALVKRIHEARHILLLGGDLAISLVEFLDYRPTLLGFPEIAATTPGHMANATRNCHEDVLDEVLLILQTEIQSS